MSWAWRLWAAVPLPVLHALGVLAGWVAYAFAPRYRARLRENLLAARLVSDPSSLRRLIRASAAEAGKAVLELPAIWFRKADAVLRLVRHVEGWEHVQAAVSGGRGAILLTPHLGCFEIAGLYCGAHFPFMELYRPPKLAWLEPLMRAGRARGQVALATTDYAGVRKLLAALKRGEAIGVLPDQVPGGGEGVWAEFFGRPAYTMTLIARLQAKSAAPLIFLYAERLGWGRGYAIRVLPPLAALPHDAKEAATVVNRVIEDIVRACPAQYLWSYNRYKVPRGVRVEA